MANAPDDPFGDTLGIAGQIPTVPGNSEQLPDTLSVGMKATGTDIALMGARRVEVKRRTDLVLSRLKAIAHRGWFYEWEVNTKGGGKSVVRGISIKGAMAVMREWGNCSIVTTDVKETPTHWYITATFLDLETGTALSRTWPQSKTQNVGAGMDKERAMTMRFAIGESKYHRSLVQHLLEDVCDTAVDYAMSGLLEWVKDNHDKAVNWIKGALQQLGVEQTHVEQEFASPLDKMKPEFLQRIFTRCRTCIEDCKDSLP